MIAQGGEAGGHTGEVATVVLVPAIVGAREGRAPVLAAGGIGSGSQVAAAIGTGDEAEAAARMREIIERATAAR